MNYSSLDFAGRKLIVGVGSALVDLLIHESEEFVAALDGPKGGMTLVDDQIQNDILVKSDSAPKVVAGGSACNTIVGVGQLGGQAKFIGKRGNDLMGDHFVADLVSNRVEPALSTSDTSTGRVLSIITPDAQRTMFTYLGASSELTTDEITPAQMTNAAIVHLEGYLLFNRDLIEAAMKAAREAGALISLDLASFTVVEAAKEYLDELIYNYVDILMANEDEAKALTGESDEIKAIHSLSNRSKIAVLKTGASGSLISYAGDTLPIPPIGDGNIIDTTGAGDLWAAGLLFGLVTGFPLEKCGRLASACGWEVCRVVGASIPNEGWQRIRLILED